MQERDLIDIVARTIGEHEVGKPLNECIPNWRHGWMHPKTRMALLYNPPAMEIEYIPMQLNGIGEDIRFGIIDVLENLTPAHWNIWRSLS